MDPYRPLHVVDRRSDDDPPDDDRALAVLLIVLGLARVVPAICLGEDFGAEASIALLMLAGGLAIVFQIPRLVMRARRRA